MPVPPAPLPSDLGDAFTCAAALDAGVSRRRLRARDLGAPHRGVRTRPAEAGLPGIREADADHRDRVRAAALRRARAYAAVMRPHCFFTGRFALALHGLPLERLDGEELAGEGIAGGDAPIDVGAHLPARSPRARGVRGIRTTPALAPVRVHAGLRISSPAATWALLARELDVPALVRLGDAVVHVPRDDRGRRQPGLQLATPAQLRRAAEAPQRRHRTKLLGALEHIRVGSASPLETDWRLGAVGAGLPAFELDVEVHDATGRLLGIADALHRRHRTIVEVEGDHHRTSRAQWSRDIEKHAAYVADGWEVVRLTGAHIRGHAPRAPEILRAVLLRRGWRP
ncbi:hypothetical protein [Microbacterium sp. No. 7]|uniref:hypothetical protein n=1 Tax=Microbacterium sp. No. 7 TaxID=1714373 RepID=UPI0006D1A4B0|nr:hypothetical protein [Microbacterium sp. No. 7]ALJ21616.1 hypothetical protein AOA12_17645 [Microbacterium sp. No. 7]